MQIYRVGGYVRDKLLGITPNDCDYVVVGSSPKEMLEFGYRQVGKFFPVFLHPQTGEEYALARTESKYGTGHTGFKVNASPNVSLEQDLLRRDITINAIAEDKNGNLIDPYNGCSDLQNRLLRHVSSAFSEDPLRILRVARFAAKLNFTVANETLDLMQMMALNGDGLSLSRERVLNELGRALECNYSEQFFIVLHQTQNLQIFFPRLALSLSKSNNMITFCQELKFTTIQLQRYQLIALYLDDGTTNENISEITHEKKLFKSLSHTQLIQQLCKANALDAQSILTFFKQLDIWRNHEQFKLLAENYAIYLTSCKKDHLLTKLRKIQNIAQQLKVAPLQNLIIKFKTQPMQLATAIQNYYLNLILKNMD